MLTTTLTIRGVSTEKISALHALFAGDDLCSKVVQSAIIAQVDSAKAKEWMGNHKSFPIAGLKSSQFNSKQGTYTVEVEVICECVLFDVQVTKQSINYGKQLANCLRFRPSNKALLPIYQTLGWLDDADRLEAVEIH